MQQDASEEAKTPNYRVINTDVQQQSQRNTEGLNLQVLHLMQSMKIDITKTKQVIVNPTCNTLSVKKKSAKSDLIFVLWLKFSNPLFSIVIICDWLNFRPTKN